MRCERWASFGLLILRIGTCIFLANHGYGKWQMVQAGEFDKVPDPFGFLGPKAPLYLLMTAEFICPMLIGLGFLTRLATIPPIIAMATAVFKAHANDPWFMSEAGNGREPAMMFLIPMLALLFTGAGCYSIDALLFKRRTQPGF